MVSTAIIRRLAGEIEGLEQRLKSRRGFLAVFIDCASFSDREAVQRRHFQLYPDQSDPDVIMTSVRPSRMSDIDDGDDQQRNTAWRQLAREEIQSYPRDELLHLWGERSIKDALWNAKSDRWWSVRGVAEAVEIWGFPEGEAIAMLRSAGIDVDCERFASDWEFGRAFATRRQRGLGKRVVA